MKLTKRLEAIASFIPSSGGVIDVGCNHAYICMYVALNSKKRKIIGTDCNPKSLKEAYLEISKRKLNEKISIVVTTGLDNITIDRDDTIIISKDVVTQSVTERNLEESYNTTYGTVKIKNQSDYDLTDDICNTSDLSLTNTNKILIYHTHTCESYTPSEKYNYTMTGNYRTTDNNYNMVKVGEELTKYLQQKGFTVIHNTTCHDYPSYSGSYDRSYTTAQSVLNNDPDIGLVIDLHRDAVGDGSSYGPTIKVNGESVAQLMFVIGTDGGGLEHPNWKQNLKTAIKIQETANNIYPGLFRPMIVRNSRYNQHLAKGASIIEVGATGNTLEECLLSMQCLANVIDEAF